MHETVRIFENEMDAILHHDILTHEAYRLTPSHAAFMGKYSTCRLQRILIVLKRKTVSELQILVSGYVRGVPFSGMNKYALVTCLAYHYVNDSFTRRHLTIDADVGLISQVFLRYINRAWVDKMSNATNHERLYHDVMEDFVVLDRFERTRRRHLQNLQQVWNGQTMEQRRMFLYNGAFAMCVPGPHNVNFHRFFGNVKMDEIVTTFPQLQVFSPGYDDRILQFRKVIDALPTVKFIPTVQFESTQECPICYETTCNAYTDCKHEFCIGCIRTHIDICRTTRKKSTCPMCREEVTQVFENSTARARAPVVDLTIEDDYEVNHVAIDI
jgi:hypothetical protein